MTFKYFDIDKAKIDIEPEERAVISTISTAAVDRDKEVVLPQGADLKNYRKNPVVLWAHQSTTPPIGKMAWIKTDKNKGLIAKTIFAETDRANEVYELYKGGFLKAFSIGFMSRESREPKEQDLKNHPEWAEVRRIHSKWELFEYSAVPVPSNPEALAIAVNKGMELSDELKKDLHIAKDFEDLEYEDIELKPAPDITENYIRWRIKDPDLFVRNSFRVIDISKKEGIKATVGKLKKDPDGPTHVQSYLFDKDKWTVEQAREWVNERKDFNPFKKSKIVKVIKSEPKLLSVYKTGVKKYKVPVKQVVGNEIIEQIKRIRGIV